MVEPKVHHAWRWNRHLAWVQLVRTLVIGFVGRIPMKAWISATAAVVALAACAGVEPISADRSGSEGSLYVTSWYGRSITVVDVGTRQVVRTIPVGIQDHNVALNPSQTQAWVTNNSAGTRRNKIP